MATDQVIDKLLGVKASLNKQLDEALDAYTGSLKPDEVKAPETNQAAVYQVIKWMRLCKFYDPTKVTSPSDDTFTVSTTRNRYSITAQPTYIGGTVIRKSDGKGNDLSDGPFSKDTFMMILSDIAFFETRE